MKKRVAIEKERVSILSEQKKTCPRPHTLSAAYFLSFYVLTFLSKTRRKWLGIGWVQYRYFGEMLEGEL